jgi:hypothetical protein
MNKMYLLPTIIIILMSSMLTAATRERPMLVRVTLDKTRISEVIHGGRYDIASVSRNGVVDIVADDNDLAALQKAGLNPVVVHSDLIGFYQSRMPATATMGGFPTFTEALAIMDSLHQLYPSITTGRDSIGNTYEGRAIWAMKISDNPDQDEDEPEFFVNSLIHAREPMGLEATLLFMRYLCENYGIDSTVTYLVNNREFYFVPMINPDGYEYNRQYSPQGGGMWRKNRHGQGIDLNRNWGYMWGYDDDGSSPNPWDETYRGTAAFSEPETQALRQYIDTHHFSIVMNFHSYANDFLYSWCYEDLFTPDEPLLQVIADSVTANNGYASGTAWEVLYNTNGDSNDWQYGEQTEKPKIFGFTMEIGNNNDGFWPDPSRIPALWNDVLPSLLFLSKIAADPYAVGAPSAPVLAPIGDVYTDSFTVSWHHADSLNPAVAFELKEFSGLSRVSDDFEADNSYWSFNGFSRSTARHHSGSYSLFSGSQDSYNGSATLENPISVVAGDTLHFWAWYSIENGYDYAYVSASTDGGATFTNLAGNITTTSNPYGNNQGNGITGNSNSWRQAKFPLDSFIGQSIILKLRYVTDAATLNEGFYADEFSPIEIFQQENILGSAITDTSFIVSGRAEGLYYYEVRAMDAQGQWSGYSNRERAVVHPNVGITEPLLPSALTLNQNYPNPFNPTTTISFSLPHKSYAELDVYSITGAKINTLLNSQLAAGNYNIIFTGKDDNGKSLSTGVYFYRLVVNGQILTRKMILLK